MPSARLMQKHTLPWDANQPTDALEAPSNPAVMATAALEAQPIQHPEVNRARISSVPAQCDTFLGRGVGATAPSKGPGETLNVC